MPRGADKTKPRAGELALVDGRPQLRARVCRVVDGLNLDLLEKAISTQRAFLRGLPLSAAAPQ